jgi:perosamine synthetase
MSVTIATTSKLAIHGGKPVRTELFPAYNTITDVEKKAAMEVLDSGNLSQFLGCWMDDFFGGPKVREFEEKWSKMFKLSSRPIP